MGEQKTAIKLMLLKDPSMSVDDLEQALRREGYDPTPTRLAIASIRSEFRDTLKLLKREGRIEIDLYRERTREGAVGLGLPMPASRKTRQREKRTKIARDLPRKRRIRPWHFNG